MLETIRRIFTLLKKKKNDIFNNSFLSISIKFIMFGIKLSFRTDTLCRKLKRDGMDLIWHWLQRLALREVFFFFIKSYPGGTEWQFLVPPSLLNCSSALQNRNFFFFGHAGALYCHHSFLCLLWIQIHIALLRFHY